MADLASSRVFGNLKVTGVLNGDGSGLTGTASLRATGTTASDVGLGSVDNYSRAHYDGRYLAAGGKAVDADKLDGKHASAFALTSGSYSGLRARATTKGDVGLGSVRNVSSYSQAEANSNFAAASHSHSYLPLSGGTLSGNLSVTGAITATGNVTAYSDARLKTNVEKIPDALEKVSKLSGYTYDRTDMETERQTGVIAQEVLEVLPEAVTGGPTDKDPDGHYSVAYGNMVGLLIEALKEEKSKRESLENRLEKLEALLGEQN